jgi:hypothetical protein
MISQDRNRKFGIEIEYVGATRSEVARAISDAGVACHVEGYNHTTRSYWKIVTDASLHDRSGLTGEIVSPILQGEDGFAQLKKVCDAINSIEGVTVNRSCGLHVHLDAQSMTVSQVAKVFERYARFEDDIDNIMPRSRRGESRWAHSIKNRVSSVTACTSKDSQECAMGRYYKVNLTNVARRGAIEFRQHSGTTCYTKISMWVKFLMDFVTKSCEIADARQPVSYSFRGRRTVPFDIARKVVAANGGALNWRGNRYVLNMGRGYQTSVSPEALETFYNPEDVQDFDYEAFLVFIGVSQDAPRSVEDATFYNGVSTEVSNYLDARYDELN